MKAERLYELENIVRNKKWESDNRYIKLKDYSKIVDGFKTSSYELPDIYIKKDKVFSSKEYGYLIRAMRIPFNNMLEYIELYKEDKMSSKQTALLFHCIGLKHNCNRRVVSERFKEFSKLYNEYGDTLKDAKGKVKIIK